MDITSDAEHFTFPATDALSLYVRFWKPEGEPRAVVQLSHGMAEHVERYDVFARALTDKGFVVYAHEHRGHGHSVPEGQPLGHMGDADTFDLAVADLISLTEHLRKEHPGKKLVLMGHSMGSFFVQRFLATRGDLLDAAILSGSTGKPPAIATLGRLIARLERLRAGKAGTSNLLQALSFGDFNKKFKPNRTEFDWLSRDEAEVDKYIADPLCGFPVSTQTWIDLLDALPTLTQAEAVAAMPKDLPVYITSGTRDATGDMGRGIDDLSGRYRAAQMTVEVKMYAEGRHEMLNETNRDEVVADLVGWIEKTVGG